VSFNVLTQGVGRPLLLLHGFTGSARAWAAQIEVWSETHRVIAPDLLGHAGSEAPEDPARHALDRQAAELADLLGLLDATPAAVVGYSMGARLALALVVAHPDVVDGLVLESPSAGIRDPEARRQRRLADEQLAQELERDSIEAFVDGWEALPLFASQASVSEDARATLRHERLRHEPRGLAASLRGAGQGAMSPLHDRLDHIDVPTLVLAGALDTTGLERARIVADGIPDARLEVIASAGHSPHLEAPAEFGRLVDAHLQAVHVTH
jgi:2-succinyl-6-hydroxy-2,4-cyclohexadiene-1-carboxylate synthase